MQWIFDHPQLLLAIGGAIAWWLNQRNKQQREEETPPPHQEKTFEDPELAERTRRIREEIQRKIEERARGYTQPAAPSAPPPVPETYAETPPPLIVREQPSRPVASVPLPRYSRVESTRQAEILEQQAALAEQLRMADEMKRAAQKRAAFEAAVQAEDAGHKKHARERVALRDDLRSPEALRRAFVMREVLGPPVALK